MRSGLNQLFPYQLQIGWDLWRISWKKTIRPRLTLEKILEGGEQTGAFCPGPKRLGQQPPLQSLMWVHIYFCFLNMIPQNQKILKAMSSFLHIGILKSSWACARFIISKLFFPFNISTCFGFFIIKKFILYLFSFPLVLYVDLILILSQDILQDSLILALVSLFSFLFINLSDCVHARE